MHSSAMIGDNCKNWKQNGWLVVTLYLNLVLAVNEWYESTVFVVLGYVRLGIVFLSEGALNNHRYFGSVLLKSIQWNSFL